MAVSPSDIQQWCRPIIDADARDHNLSLTDYLEAIPGLDSLADLPSGTTVLVRGDVDAKPGEKKGKGDIRLQSMVETLNFGRERGWKQVIFGHIGRDPELSLDKVAARLGEWLGTDVPLIRDWLDQSSQTITASAAETIDSAEPGTVMMLDNTRKYDIERVLWKAKPDDLPKLSEPLAKVANEFAGKVATVYVNEALSAGSLDTSSVVVPIAMEKAVLGKYVASEFQGPMMRCLETQLVIFSGLKIDKLDDLEAMIDRGKIQTVFSAGSLAMALKRASAELDGTSFSLGVAEDPEHSDKPYFIPEKRIEQAKEIVSRGRSRGVEFVLPVDFVLASGSTSETIGPGEQQLDVGPKTTQRFEAKVGEFIDKHAPGGVVFHNGVFGKFEDPHFETGTKEFVKQLKRLKEAGCEVYVGGGEGGKALEKYGEPDWVTHVFTAGGTVLNALGSEPVPYLMALRQAQQ